MCGCIQYEVHVKSFVIYVCVGVFNTKSMLKVSLLSYLKFSLPCYNKKKHTHTQDNLAKIIMILTSLFNRWSTH